MDEANQPITPAQEDLNRARADTHAGQRRINLIWEKTQASLAIIITIATVVGVLLVIFLPVSGPIAFAAIIFLTNLEVLVVNSYFQRTNHTRIGGVGLHHQGR